MALKKLNRQCGSLKTKLTLLEQYTDEKLIEDQDLKPACVELNCKIDGVKRIETEIEKMRDAYYEIASDEELPAIEASLAELEIRIEKVKVSLFTFIENYENKSGSSKNNISSATSSNAYNSVLPNVPLPVFDGSFEHFSTFKASFENLIKCHPLLLDSQKLFFLRSCLQGKAKSVETADDTYDSLMNALIDRYENRRVLIDTHINNIINYPNIVHESAKDLRELLDTIKRNLRALKLLNYDRDNLSNVILFNLIIPKLDKNSRVQFELTLKSQDVPEFDNLLEFIEKRSHVLEALSRSVLSKVIPTKTPIVTNSFHRSKSLLIKSQSTNHCVVCKDNFHNIYKCKKFKDMNVDQRCELVQKNKLCFNCLSSTHLIVNCKSNVKCSICNRGNHHSLLHRNREYISPVRNCSDNSSSYVNSKETRVKEVSNSVLFSSGYSKFVLINTAIVYVRDSQNIKRPLRAILDSAAQSNFITSEAANALGISKQKINVPICGLNDSTFNIKSQVTIQLTNANDDFKWCVDLLVVPKITDLTPSKLLNVSSFKIPDNITLADSEFFRPNKVQMLLGAELFFHFLKSDKIYLEDNRLLLQDSCFGYLVSGSIQLSKFDNSLNRNCLLSMESLNDSIKSFWEIESVPEPDLIQSDELKYCEEHFKNTHYRKPDGRYVVQMPIDPNVSGIPLGDSKTLAMLRLEQLWRRLERQPAMKELYINFMSEYERLDHMVETSDDLNVTEEYFLPHHGVYRPQSSSTKLRVVFNASAKSSNGNSLNDILLKGGIIQDELFAIALRFRKHVYAFSADVEKMFRQVEIDPSQTFLQRVLWKKGKNEPVKIYNLQTVTYGTTSAPFLATRTLQQIGIDEGKSFPRAAAVIPDFYMDDCLSGSSDLQEAKSIQVELIQMLERGGMTLHKWYSNHPDLQLSEDSIYPFDYSQEDKSCVKTLGMEWNTSIDVFTFKVSVKNEKIFTKRSVLSEIARIFDPLGLLGPIISKAKIFLQRLWLLKTDWHEPLPQNVAQEWREFVNSLHFIENFEIPRCVILPSSEKVIIHGFADASISAYGAVVYIQSVSKVVTSSHLLCSKSRVSPIKTLTIPRLELSACLLLAKLVHKCLKALKLNISEVLLWSDSTIALSWIKTSPHQLKTFVSNRVAQIQRLTEHFQWSHVCSELNPADLISRGVSANELLYKEMWFNGPQFLMKEVNVPKTTVDNNTDVLFLKELKTISDINLPLIDNNDFFDNLMKITNVYVKLIRILSFICRFLFNCKHSKEKCVGPISTSEFMNSRDILVRYFQNKYFSQEILDLQRNSEVKPNSKLRALNPFLDEKSILRVGGRLHFSALKYNHKHPIILPPGNKLTTLIFEYYHVRDFHIGPQNLLHTVRQNFWPLKGKDLARKIVHNCVICFKNKPIVCNQLMGNLPAERIVPNSTFENSGLDLCGPFSIRYKNQRRGTYQKIYIAIFICMVTKAVHFEFVSDLTTEALIACLKRFCARRGKVSTLFCDNATNFVGAHHELNRFRNLAVEPEDALASFLTSENIEWKFLPPRAPNFGGLWESGVKSFKFHLRRAIGYMKLTLEEFITVATQIEGILNSRPLTPLTTDTDNYEVLTPGHFLIGRPLNAIPEPDLCEKNDNILSRWQRTTKIVQIVWKKWHKDYLSHLNQRCKWQFQKENITPNILVLIKEDNLPPLKWCMGRIKHVVKGKDGKVRVVVVKTSKGEFKRPISKICILPIV